MHKLSFEKIERVLYSILKKYHFPDQKAQLIAKTYTQSSCDGVYSHGLNRFPLFIDYVNRGLVDVTADPEKTASFGSMEQWDGNRGAGISNAHQSMERAMSLAQKHSMGCVALRNTNHWMRGGTYGWQAAEKGKIAICFTNTKPNMPPWGGRENRVGNNPFVVAIPRKNGHVVLDMAMSQFALGTINSYKLDGEQLPLPGGWDNDGNLTQNPEKIMDSGAALPVGYWKGSAMAMVLDMLAALLSEGKPTCKIGGKGRETDLSQIFICIEPDKFSHADIKEELLNNIINHVHDVPPMHQGDQTFYPGEKTLATRKDHLKNGIPVDDGVWEEINQLI